MPHLTQSQGEEQKLDKIKKSWDRRLHEGGWASLTMILPNREFISVDFPLWTLSVLQHLVPASIRPR